jgi:DNA-binding NtrC family response regulator
METGIAANARRCSVHRILVVDDEPVVCDLLAAALSRAGHRVIVAGSGAEAIATVARDRFSLMLIDFNLRDKNGIDLLATIRSLHPDCVAFLMTGHMSSADIARCRQAGFAECLIKPIGLATLIEIAGMTGAAEKEAASGNEVASADSTTRGANAHFDCHAGL